MEIIRETHKDIIADVIANFESHTNRFPLAVFLFGEEFNLTEDVAEFMLIRELES